ncbi:MAG: hypothetical protein VYC55_08075 [Pseudomonadota bacterium]|nr:hypothetical protein [Pseudomonadota bacterium]
MPCYDSRDSAEHVINEKAKEIDKLEAAICACVNFAVSKGLISELETYARIHSQFDLRQWIKKHEKKDKERIIAQLKNEEFRKLLSDDEIRILVESLSK